MKPANRRAMLRYWIARLLLNSVSIGVVATMAGLLGLQFSWRLYLCAFACYATLSFGDGALDALFPVLPTASHEARKP